MKTQNLVSWAILGMFVFATVMVVRSQTSKKEGKSGACGCGA